MNTSVPFNKARWRSTHNSYSGAERGGVPQQLDAGVRFVELDVHYDGSRSGDARFRVGHDDPGAEVYYGGGNPAGDALGAWLDVLVAWSNANARHTPITLALDSKDNLGASGSESLNDLVCARLGDKLFRADALTGDWPAVETLRGRVLVVLSGDVSTRKHYKDRDQVMFVEYQRKDDDNDLKKRTWFWAESADKDYGWALDGMKDGKIVRLWQFDKSNADRGKAVSLPATDTPFAGWYADYAREIGAGDDGEPGSALVFPPAAWTDSHRYDDGVTPRVAVNSAGVAVEVHKSQNQQTLWYHVGAVDAASLRVEWGDSHRYDSGVTPAVAINASGVVVEVHQSQNEPTLWYRVGTVNAATRTIEWGEAHRYDSGVAPAVAINASGVVVEVHQSQNEPTLWYHVGRVDPERRTIAWGESHRYDDGMRPCVAINDAGVVIEVHESQNDSALWYHVGAVDGAAKTVAMEPSHRYDAGLNPVVAMDNTGVIVEVHRSQNEQTLWYHLGRINGSFVGWLASYRYDSGVAPAVALLSGSVVVEAHQSQNQPTLWWHVAKVRTAP